MVDFTSILSLAFIIGTLVHVLISSTVLYMSVKIVGGKAKIKESIVLTTVMRMLNLFVFPLFSSSLGTYSGIISLVLYYALWLLLVMKFFEVSFWRAVLVAIVQGIVETVLVFLGIMAIVGTLVGAITLVR